MPVSQSVSSVGFDQIKEPLVYVCDIGQVNYTILQQYGYKDYETFLLGSVKGLDNASWSGKNGDKTFAEIKEIVYQDDYTNFRSIYLHLKGADLESMDYETELAFIQPKGFCQKLCKVNSGTAFFYTNKKTTLYLVDPYYANSIRLLGRENLMLNFGLQENGLYESSNYDIEFDLFDSSIMDGQSCTDYDKLGKSYGECLENEMKDVMLKRLGCLLPWFPDTIHPECESVPQTEKNFKVMKDTTMFIFGMPTGFFHSCLPPCRRMSFKLKKLEDWLASNGTQLQINLADKVTVHTDYYAYDEFSFVVDLGSALGLWLGLSAVSIFEAFLHVFNITRNFCNHCGTPSAPNIRD